MSDEPNAPEPIEEPGRDAEPDVADGIGKRLRDARQEAGISLRELARRIGTSASLVSQIENEKVQPSVRSLYAIVSELGVSMDDIVFGAERAEPGPSRGEAVRGHGLVKPDEPLIQRHETRHAIRFGSGVRWELLTPVPLEGTEFLYVVYEPGAESSAAGRFHRHAGREWSVILSGTLHVSIAFDEYELGPGDSITFDSTVPHRLANRGTEPVEALWFQIGELPPADED